MDLTELLATDANSLKKRQHDALQKAVVEFLRDVALAIEKGEYNSVDSLTQHSPSGDGYGCDNVFLDFSSVWQSDDPYGTDIGMVIGKLKELSK